MNMSQPSKWTWMGSCLYVWLASTTAAVFAAAPDAPGKLIDLGGHKLHMNCRGTGHPTVVVENGLGDFSFDWILVQNRVSQFTRICSYDRAGYAFSDRGPQPRTFDQLNLELHDALVKSGERGPFVLVGHSFGGPVVRNFARVYPRDVAGIVLVDAAFEGQRVGIGGKRTMRLGEDAKGRDIPLAHEEMRDSDRSSPRASGTTQAAEAKLDPMYKVLPDREQKLQLWAQALPEMEAAEDSQREWSGEYFAKLLKAPESRPLGAIPLVVLTRAEGGYSDQDVSALQLEKERKEGQAKLAQLSTNGRQSIIRSGHNMELEAPGEVAAAIRQVVDAVRTHGKL
jgi:pimeloyl-ACP methyl ester carboxylesterase